MADAMDSKSIGRKVVRVQVPPSALSIMPTPEEQAPVYPQSMASIFWVEVDKIKPNPYQPRKEFNEDSLRDLADSIRQYGVLQPLVVTRKEVQRDDGGLATEYELIAGERRLRASKMAGVTQVPVLIREGEDSERTKLELAIIENIQREDLNPIDRGRAFSRLAEQFHYKHTEIAKKVGKSREYVSNSIRLLSLPEKIADALYTKRISEGHARSLLMLIDRPDEQMTLYKEIMYKNLSVRETEMMTRRIAFERVRKKQYLVDPEIMSIEEKLTERLGTRVQIERKEYGGKVVIDFFSQDDLKNFLALVSTGEGLSMAGLRVRKVAEPRPEEIANVAPAVEELVVPRVAVMPTMPETIPEPAAEEELSALPPLGQEEEDLYSIKNFSI
jgi:ParB family chromosome partitioning protein